MDFRGTHSTPGRSMPRVVAPLGGSFTRSPITAQGFPRRRVLLSTGATVCRVLLIHYNTPRSWFKPVARQAFNQLAFIALPPPAPGPGSGRFYPHGIPTRAQLTIHLIYHGCLAIPLRRSTRVETHRRTAPVSVLCTRRRCSGRRVNMLPDIETPGDTPGRDLRLIVG